MRADRLVSLVLLLQARGRTAASVLAAELEVSVRTIYRDLEALSAAGVPVVTEPGPGGGCRLLDDYRFPLRSLRSDEAEALLILGVPHALSELGLDLALTAARRRVGVAAGMAAEPAALVHLDMPRWFGRPEEVPCLRTLAQALRLGRQLQIGYRRGPDDAVKPRRVGPLGLVNKAGAWYLVGLTGLGGDADPLVFRVSRVATATLLPQSVERPAGFELALFWAGWSAEFMASRPRLDVTLRVSPSALSVFPGIFGDSAGPAIDSAAPPDQDGWRVLTLGFEHEIAAAHRLAGFGDLVEVLEPQRVRTRLAGIGQALADRYR